MGAGLFMPGGGGQRTDGGTAGTTDQSAGDQTATSQGTDGSTADSADRTTRQRALLLLGHVIASGHSQAGDESDNGRCFTHGYLQSR